MTPPLKWHGGKHYLASKIIALMPPHTHYVEPYFGGGAVLLAKDPEGVSEVVNDLDFELTTFWRVLQNPQLFEKFKRRMEAMPLSEVEFDVEAEAYIDSEFDVASAFFVHCRQSMSGRMKAFAPVSRNRTSRGMNENASSWLGAIEGLPEVHARLKRVVILNRDALEVIKGQDGPGTLFYLDPPYLHETRATTGEYAHEMTEEQHASLLTVLGDVKGKFLLSGYHSTLYDTWASHHCWNVHEFDLPNNAASGPTKRRMTECVWTNF